MGRTLSIEERTRKTYYFSRQGSLISQNPPALAVGSMSKAVRYPRIDKVETLAKYLGTTTTNLMGEVPNTPKPDNGWTVVYNAKISERIRNLRIDKGLSQKDLGKLIGKSLQTISNWERGYTPNITQDDIKLLANALNVSTNYLIGDTTPPSSGLLGFLFSDEPELLQLVNKISIDGKIKLDDSVAQLTERQKERLKDIIRMTIDESVKSAETIVVHITPKKNP